MFGGALMGPRSFDLLGPIADPYAALAADIQALIDRRPVGGYRLGIGDCPWQILMRSSKGYERAPQRHYPCVPTSVLAALPVGQLFAPDSVMLLWGTSPMLDQQMAVLRAWGFTYKGFLPWFKGSPNSMGDDCDDPDWNPAFGGGYLFRNCSEIMLVGTRGDPVLKDDRRKLRGAFFAARREHSRKPDEQYTHAEALSDGPYIELFSRTNRKGWASFGNMAGVFGDV